MLQIDVPKTSSSMAKATAEDAKVIEIVAQAVIIPHFPNVSSVFASRLKNPAPGL